MATIIHTLESAKSNTSLYYWLLYIREFTLFGNIHQYTRLSQFKYTLTLLSIVYKSIWIHFKWRQKRVSLLLFRWFGATASLSSQHVGCCDLKIGASADPVDNSEGPPLLNTVDSSLRSPTARTHTYWEIIWCGQEFPAWLRLYHFENVLSGQNRSRNTF